MIKTLPPGRTKIYSFIGGQFFYDSFMVVVVKLMRYFLFRVEKVEHKLGPLSSGFWGHKELTTLRFTVLNPELIDLLYQAQFGQTAIRTNPVLGLSLDTDFKKTDKRDVFIPTPLDLVKMPIDADGFKVSQPIEIMIHDLYFHCMLDSANRHRDIYTGLAECFEKTRTDELAPYGKDLFKFFTDRQFAGYLEPNYSVFKPDYGYVFWSVVLFQGPMKVFERNAFKNLDETKHRPILVAYYKAVLDHLLGSQREVRSDLGDVHFDSFKQKLNILRLKTRLDSFDLESGSVSKEKQLGLCNYLVDIFNVMKKQPIDEF